MSYYNGPKLVTNGLICCLDAGNPKSYIGSGNAWNDISGNSYNFTLTNNPTFGAHKGTPCFSFSGANDYAVRSGTINHDIGTACTVQFVMASISNTDFGLCSRLISMNAGNTTNNDYTTYFCLASCDQTRYGLWYKNSPAGMYPTSVLKTASDDFKVLVFSWTASGTARVYVNGVLENSAACTTAFTYTNISRTCLGYNSTLVEENAYVRIASFCMYNRQLNNDEVLENYNAIKARFGL